jgi:hypothetical protein
LLATCRIQVAVFISAHNKIYEERGRFVGFVGFGVICYLNLE